MQNRLKQSNHKLRVCLVSPKAYPLFNHDIKATFGGAEVDLYYLGTELAKDQGFKVSFITADYGQGQIENHENADVIKSLACLTSIAIVADPTRFPFDNISAVYPMRVSKCGPHFRVTAPIQRAARCTPYNGRLARIICHKT